ncbi:hypothetical protein ABT364_23190 [Massilia sp. SR12]
MLANIIESATGFRCQPIDEIGNCVVLAPRPFKDEPEVFLYVIKIKDKLLLTDDAEVYLHHAYCKEAVDAIAGIVRASGLEFKDASVQLRCELKDLKPALDKFLATMAELAAHERDFNRMSAQAWDADVMRR